MEEKEDGSDEKGRNCVLKLLNNERNKGKKKFNLYSLILFLKNHQNSDIIHKYNQSINQNMERKEAN